MNGLNNLKRNKMKNIHLVPTDKPSRLAYDFDKLILNSRLLSPILYKTQNIYITSDEEIKEGDWFIFGVNESVLRMLEAACKANIKYNGAKKIMLATDPQLIKFGVQAINDDFLEWFVKNPSCEEVEVEEFEPIYGHQNNSSSVLYKTIIPKEEPKERLKKILGTKHPKQEINLEEVFNDDKKENIKKFIDEIINPSQPNQALKDAAERLKGRELFKESNDRARKILSEIKSLPIQDETEHLLSTKANRNRLICKDCNDSLEDCTCIEDTIEFPKQEPKQEQERSYSEEEVIQLVSDWTNYRMSEDTKSKVKFKEWFEQFKKK